METPAVKDKLLGLGRYIDSQKIVAYKPTGNAPLFRPSFRNGNRFPGYINPGDISPLTGQPDAVGAGSATYIQYGSPAHRPARDSTDEIGVGAPGIPGKLISYITLIPT